MNLPQVGKYKLRFMKGVLQTKSNRALACCNEVESRNLFEANFHLALKWAIGRSDFFQHLKCSKNPLFSDPGHNHKTEALATAFSCDITSISAETLVQNTL